MKKLNTPLTEDEKKLLLVTPEEEYGVVFPQHSRAFLRAAKKNVSTGEYSPVNINPVDSKLLIEKVKKLLEKRRSLYEIANILDVSPKRVENIMTVIGDNNVLIDKFSDGTVQVGSTIIQDDDFLRINITKHKEKEIGFGFVADTHLGSKYERLDVLNALYDRFEQYGIETVYHGGNWIDGEARFNMHDIYVHGIEEQIANFLSKYPKREGIKTYIISGDDHEGWYVQRDHVHIGKLMESRARDAGRDDLIDLGYMERDIKLENKNGSSILRVIHAGGGSSYATSYTAQKYVESLQGGEKPQIILVGHYHKFDYSYPREVHVIQGGCTEDQTPFMRKKKLQAMIGGCVIWIKQNENGIITSLKIEWIPFYDKKFYTYKW